jgi:hypothetical protein
MAKAAGLKPQIDRGHQMSPWRTIEQHLRGDPI